MNLCGWKKAIRARKTYKAATWEWPDLDGPAALFSCKHPLPDVVSQHRRPSLHLRLHLPPELVTRLNRWCHWELCHYCRYACPLWLYSLRCRCCCRCCCCYCCLMIHSLLSQLPETWSSHLRTRALCPSFASWCPPHQRRSKSAIQAVDRIEYTRIVKTIR